MNPLHSTCKKATYLVSKKEEGKLSWLESIRLRGHLAICSLCRRFESQTSFINRMAKQSLLEARLSEEARERIRKSIVDSHRP